MTAPDTDPVELTRRLIRCASVTPQDDGAIDVLRDLLESAGFACTRVDRGGIANLFARWGDKGHARTFGFNGHTDVVPPGDETAWRFPPFSAEIHDGQIWGRGATDMKSGVAAFAAAAMDFVRTSPPDGAVVLAITGDEEGDAADGTVALLDWMAENDEKITECLVGEPTCPDQMGEMLKIGRRGSMTVYITAAGVQGHTAYPHRASNAAAAIATLIHRLTHTPLDGGTDHFDASTLAVTTIDVGNPATNVVPGQAQATVNIRFNDTHSGASLTEWMEAECEAVTKETGVTFEARVKVSGESFVTSPGPLSNLVAGAVQAETGIAPTLSTTGGTSDARFIKDHCPVVEFGLVGRTMHEVNERVSVEQIGQLKAIYGRILRDYFT